MRVIDVHAHMTPQFVVAATAKGTGVHGIDPAAFSSGLGHAMSPGQHIAEIDTLSIDVQVLSPQGQLYCYEHDATNVAALHRECNDSLRQVVVDYPTRLVGLAILPMQDVALAVAELERAITVLGLKGAMIGDHVNGVNYDDVGFRPFWAAAEQLGALIFLHQAPPTMIAQRLRDYHAPNSIGNLVERTVSFASIVFGGVLDEFPDLKLCLAHGGGYVCFGIGRMDWAWQWRAQAQAHASRPPSEYLASFYYDCITHNEHALRFLIDSVGVDRVLFGSDFPGFAAGKAGAGYQPVDWLHGLSSITDAEKDAILFGNLERLLGI